jgi:hypothetical protein
LQASTVNSMDKPYSSFNAGNVKQYLHNWKQL